MQGIQAYIDSRLDILQHKFLVFICNINDLHWVSVVVVNPFLVLDQYLAEGNENKSGKGKKNGKSEKEEVSGDDFVGWCLLNSTQRPSETKQHGFQGTFHTKNNAAYGVRLFLNICASYLKAKRKKGPIELDYEEPFGEWQETKGTEEFPRFDFQCPSIVSQPNSHDCGLAVVANSMAIVKHLKEKQFLKSNMRRQERRNDVCFLLDEKIYSLKPFWDILMKDGSHHRYGIISDSGDLLYKMRQEFLDIVDETAAASKADKGNYDQVQQVLKLTKVPPLNSESNEDITDGDQKPSAVEQIMK
jgi:hypothetical protein